MITKKKEVKLYIPLSIHRTLKVHVYIYKAKKTWFEFFFLQFVHIDYVLICFTLISSFN